MSELLPPEIDFSIWTPYCTTPKEQAELKKVLIEEREKGAFAIGAMGSRAMNVYNQRTLPANRDLDLVVINTLIPDINERAGSLRRLNKIDWSLWGVVGLSRWIDITRMSSIDPQFYLDSPAHRTTLLSTTWLWQQDAAALKQLIDLVKQR